MGSVAAPEPPARRREHGSRATGDDCGFPSASGSENERRDIPGFGIEIASPGIRRVGRESGLAAE